MDIIQRLQKWYFDECNGDWEHSFGVKIDTLDNPGWILKIDLAETRWEGLIVARMIDRQSEDNWIQYEVEGKQFVSCGGPFNLREMIERFFEVIEQ